MPEKKAWRRLPAGLKYVDEVAFREATSIVGMLHIEDRDLARPLRARMG